MATAIGMYEDCLRLAARCRRAASRAAKLGHQLRAINLIAAAQRYDAGAEEWRGVVPQWQWDIS